MLEMLAQLHIDPVMFLLIIAGGFFAKTYLKSWGWTMAWKTLTVGTVFMTAWIGVIWLKGEWTKELWTTAFISYVSSTSFYELLINPFVRWINAITGQTPIDTDGKP